MHIQKITIQHIDWMSRDAVYFDRWLNLSFRLPDGNSKFWVVPGWPKVHEGMCVTVLLEKPLSKGSTDQMLGWKSNVDGEPAFNAPKLRHFVFIAMSVAAAAGLFAINQQEPNKFVLAQAVVFLMTGIFCAYSCHKKRCIQKKMRELP